MERRQTYHCQVSKTYWKNRVSEKERGREKGEQGVREADICYVGIKDTNLLKKRSKAHVI